MRHTTDLGVQQLGKARATEQGSFRVRRLSEGGLEQHSKRNRQREALPLEGDNTGRTAKGEA